MKASYTSPTPQVTLRQAYGELYDPKVRHTPIVKARRKASEALGKGKLAKLV